MTDRRRFYFAFQGLLSVVLLLFFLYQKSSVENWWEGFTYLSLTLLASLLFLKVVAAPALSRPWFQTSLFLGDVVVASMTLYWTDKLQPDIYLTYFLIIFGTALTRSFAQSFLVALVATIFHVVSAWDPSLALYREPDFWLRIPFLWIMACLAAILSQDSKQSQQDQERRFQDRFLQMERVAALGQLAGEMAHRIKGPLTTIRVNAEVLSHRHGKPKDLRDGLAQIQREVAHCKDILKNLLNLGRLEEMDVKPLDLREPIRSALLAAAPQMKKRGIRLVERGFESPCRVLGDQSLLHDAIVGVAQNAVEAMPEGGTLFVGLERRTKGFHWGPADGSPGSFRLMIQDTGKGLDPNDLERIFQPFFTTKGKEGNGLGLSATLRILQNHRGSIVAESDGPGQGARFILLLPEHRPA